MGDLAEATDAVVLPLKAGSHHRSQPPPGLPVFPSIVHMVLESVRSFPLRPALVRHREGREEILTYADLGLAIEEATAGLHAQGLRAGDRAAILSYNRPEWAIADLAIMALGAVTVPIYHALPAGQVEYILRDCGARMLFVENETQFRALQPHADRCPDLTTIVCFEAGGGPGALRTWAEVVAGGRAEAGGTGAALASGLARLDRDTLCSIVYTSGTTGEPKGVMLHHGGFLTVVQSSESVFRILPSDVFLSFLPLSHLYERVGGHWCALWRGAAIAYAASIGSVVEDIPRVRPTVMVSVPRVYEKMQSRVRERVTRSGTVARWLFEWAIRTGLDYHAERDGGLAPLATRLGHAVAERLVFQAIRKRFGGRFRYAISGGAPLSSETLRFFEAMGFRMIEGYGMTETHLIVTLTPPGRARAGSCGPPIPGLEIALAEDDEILVRGPTVMRGYFGREATTREVLDPEGWLHTGDIGAFDPDGYLRITDRKKNLIITAGGKNVAPAPIENVLRASPFIEEVCLTGDGRKFIAAIVVPDFARLEEWSSGNGLAGADRAALAADPAVERRIMEEIRALQQGFASFEQVRRCFVAAEPFSLERGELTSSLKVRRKAVEEHYRAEIEGLYT